MILFTDTVFADDDGGWFESLLEKLFGSAFESAFLEVSNTLTQWVFQTPELINFTWIKKIWWFCYIFSLIACGVGIATVIIKMHIGKKEVSSSIIKAIVIALIGSTLSLYISDATIKGINEATNTLVQDTLITEYHRSENEQAILKSNLDEDEIGFDSFEGTALCKVAFGGELTDEEPLYKTFSRSNGGGGLLVLLWAMLILFLIGLFGQIRYGLLGILAGASSLWFVGCAFTGDSRPAAGYLNLFARSVFLSAIFDLAWLFSLYANRSVEFKGTGTQVLACIIFTLALIGAIWFWFRWVIKSAVRPFTLAGGQVQKHYGNMASKLGSSMESIGSRFGFEGLNIKGGKIKVSGDEHSKIGQEKIENRFKERTKDRLSMARNRYMYDRYAKASKEGIIKDLGYKRGKHIKTMSNIDTLGMNEREIKNVLSSYDLDKDIEKTEDGDLLIDSENLKKVNNILKSNYESRHVENREFKGEKGYMVKGVDDHPDEVLHTLKENSIDYKDLINIKLTKDNIKSIEQLSSLDNYNIEKRYDGSFDIKKDKDTNIQEIENILKDNKISYFKAGENLTINKDSHSALLSKADIAKEIMRKNNLNSKENFDIDFDYNKEKDMRDKLVKDLKEIGVKPEEKEILWVDKYSKDRLLENLVSINDNRVNDTKEEFAYIKFSNREIYKDIEEEINKICPEAVVSKSKLDFTKNRIKINLKYMDQVKELLKQYDDKTPYWKDDKGSVYYLDKELKRIIKHSIEPVNGRYMGKYKK